MILLTIYIAWNISGAICAMTCIQNDPPKEAWKYWVVLFCFGPSVWMVFAFMWCLMKVNRLLK